MPLVTALLTERAARKWRSCSPAERQAVLDAAQHIGVCDLDLKAVDKLVAQTTIGSYGATWPGTCTPLDSALERRGKLRMRSAELMGLAISQALTAARLYNELDYAAKWAESTGRQYRLEVPCRVGRVDILFDSGSEVVEAKYTPGWKGAMGQALAYKADLRLKSASLLLIGKPATAAEVELIERTCAVYDVTVYWC